jgi:hemoglobin
MQSIYEQIGGEKVLRQLVSDFYKDMDTSPDAQVIRAMHPEDLSSSEEKLFFFLSGWLGGPALYIQHYGHPRLRARHLPFAIGEAERDQWMSCMRKALQQSSIPQDISLELDKSLYELATHMINKNPTASSAKGILKARTE